MVRSLSKPGHRVGCLLALWLASAPAAAQNLQVFHDAALAHDPQWRAAQHALEAARQRPGQARSALLPRLSYTETRHDQRGVLRFAEEDPVNKDVEARTRTLQLTQGLIRPEQWAALRQAGAQAAQAAAQHEVARQQLSVRLVQTYLDAWVAQEDVRLAAAQIKAFDAQLELARRNYRVGATTISDVHEAQAQRDLGQAQAMAASSGLESHLTELQRLTGLMPASLHGVREDAPSPMQGLQPLPHWLGLAEQVQPEVLAAQAGLKAAEHEVQRQRASWLPSVDLTLRKGTDRSSGSITAPTDVAYRNRTTQTLVTLNWPLFEGGRSYYRLREAAASLGQAQAELELALGQASTAVRQAHAGLRSSTAQVRALLSARTSSLKALEASQVGYRIGTRINLDVLNAQSQYANVQRDLARARADALMHWMRLHAATGQLGPQAVAVVNGWLEAQGQGVQLVPDPSEDINTNQEQK
ncbi:MAG: type I secretion protein TolC [Burkholderiales bacterium]|nr:MAG: type I secretion protein TolC [Burkholderiales bacterium]